MNRFILTWLHCVHLGTNEHLVITVAGRRNAQPFQIKDFIQSGVLDRIFKSKLERFDPPAFIPVPCQGDKVGMYTDTFVYAGLLDWMHEPKNQATTKLLRHYPLRKGMQHTRVMAGTSFFMIFVF